MPHRRTSAGTTLSDAWRARPRPLMPFPRRAAPAMLSSRVSYDSRHERSPPVAVIALRQCPPPAELPTLAAAVDRWLGRAQLAPRTRHHYAADLAAEST